MRRLTLRGWRVGAGEMAAITRAATLLQDALQEVSREGWQVDADEAAESAEHGHEHSVLITSLGADVEATALAWRDAEAALRAIYDRLAEQGTPFFICTVLRHVPGDLPDAAARLLRLRRLDMLAMELSQRHGCSIIDLDRGLADVGARSLGTDYRLGGGYAAAAAAKCIAMTILAAGLDELIPYELQDPARDLIAGQAFALAPIDGAAMLSAPSVERPGNLLRIRSGHRTETAAIVYDQTESRIALYRRMLRNGQMRPRETLHLLARAMRKHGVRGTARKVLSFRNRR